MIYHSSTEISQNRTVVSRLLQTNTTSAHEHRRTLHSQSWGIWLTGRPLPPPLPPPRRLITVIKQQWLMMMTTHGRSGCYRINRRRWRLCSDIASRDIPRWRWEEMRQVLGLPETVVGRPQEMLTGPAFIHNPILLKQNLTKQISQRTAQGLSPTTNVSTKKSNLSNQPLIALKTPKSNLNIFWLP